MLNGLALCHQHRIFHRCAPAPRRAGACRYRYTKPACTAAPHCQADPSKATADITLSFADVGLSGSVTVHDVWADKDLGTFSGSYTAKAVAFHDTALLRLSAA